MLQLALFPPEILPITPDRFRPLVGPAPRAAAKPVCRADGRHPFEAAGLGSAPYAYLGCAKEHGACQFCGTAILYRYFLRSADGRSFYVGSVCIDKADADLGRFIADDVKARPTDATPTRFGDRVFIS